MQPSGAIGRVRAHDRGFGAQQSGVPAGLLPVDRRLRRSTVKAFPQGTNAVSRIFHAPSCARAMVTAVVLMLLASCLLASQVRAADDEAAWLFEPDHVTQIGLDLPTASREALAEDPDEYVRGTVSLKRDDGTKYGPFVVGVKLKGHGSFRTLDGKAAFKLKFNEFVKDQTFLGLEKLTLNNMVQDPTMLHELLAYEAFRAAGLPGWRTGYSFLRVNGDAFGVYLNIETPDGVALPHWCPHDPAPVRGRAPGRPRARRRGEVRGRRGRRGGP